jgi:hypothetical protein
MKQPDLRNMFSRASNSICISTVVAFRDPFSPTPISVAMKTQENIEEDPEAADEGDIQMEYSSN